jgi:hypothetical protein
MKSEEWLLGEDYLAIAGQWWLTPFGHITQKSEDWMIDFFFYCWIFSISHRYFFPERKRGRPSAHFMPHKGAKVFAIKKFVFLLCACGGAQLHN